MNYRMGPLPSRCSKSKNAATTWSLPVPLQVSE